MHSPSAGTSRELAAAAVGRCTAYSVEERGIKSRHLRTSWSTDRTKNLAVTSVEMGEERVLDWRVVVP